MTIARAVVLGAALVLPLTATAAKTAAPSAPIECGKTPGFQVEAEITNRDISALYVTFIGKKPTNKQAEKALRECLDVVIKRDASRDILTTAWFRKRVAASKYGDDQIDPFGPRTYLSYTAATEKIEVTKLKVGAK